MGYVLITGGAGFIGSNVADSLLSDGREVVVADNLSRPGAVRNAEWLARRHGERVRIHRADVRDAAAMTALVADAGAVYHFAAQVAVTTSVEHPAEDLDVNLLGTFNVLEAARQRSKPPPILFTSTNKVYGGLRGVRVRVDGGRYVYEDREGIDESVPLDFQSPYGCSKGAADQYVIDYARIYGMPTAVFRMSCVYGRRQWGTEDQGWVAHFGRALLAGEPITVYGDGHQVRDILWIDDLIVALRAGIRRAVMAPGEVYNIGGGPPNAVTVLETIERLSSLLGRELSIDHAAWRAADQRRYVTDTRKAECDLEWRPCVGVGAGLERLAAWLEEATERNLLPLPRRRPGARGARATAVGT